jgi:hypothetical protein
LINFLLSLFKLLFQFSQQPGPTTFSESEFRSDLTKWIICRDQPFTELEDPLLQRALARLHSGVAAVLKGGDTVKKDVMAMFAVHKEKVKAKVKVLFSFHCYHDSIIFLIHY